MKRIATFVFVLLLAYGFGQRATLNTPVQAPAFDHLDTTSISIDFSRWDPDTNSFTINSIRWNLVLGNVADDGLETERFQQVGNFVSSQLFPAIQTRFEISGDQLPAALKDSLLKLKERALTEAVQRSGLDATVTPAPE